LAGFSGFWQSMLVVTGASGRVGRLVAEELARRGERMRLVVRDPSRAPEIKGAEAVAGDYGSPDSLAKALRPGDRVFMVSLWLGGEERLKLHQSFVRAAAEARVGQVVYLSFVNARPDALFSHAREHGLTEQMLRDSGVAWTAIRNSMYADDIPAWFDPDGLVREPGNGARMSFSYRPEIAAAVAIVLTQPGHEGRIYDITTPESVSMQELAGIASEVTGHRYRYEPISDAAWLDRWREQRRPEWALEAGLTSYQALRAGEFDVVSDDYRKLTGREPAGIADIIRAHADEMPVP
jgi:uncharacterized protein YbjT (DUF2867 family)